MRGRRASETGSASVLVLGIGLLLLAAFSLCASLGVAIALRHRAEAAADLAALAGAQHADEGRDRACVAARTVAAAQHARLTQCEVVHGDVTVEVTLPLPLRLRHLGQVHAFSRAGRR